MDKRVLENNEHIDNFRFKTILDHFDFNIDFLKIIINLEKKIRQLKTKKSTKLNLVQRFFYIVIVHLKLPTRKVIIFLLNLLYLSQCIIDSFLWILK